VETKGLIRRCFELGQFFPLPDDRYGATLKRKSEDDDTKAKFWKRASKTFKNSPWLQQGSDEN
jgi:hypothetical protein